jgi:hypothetical protein
MKCPICANGELELTPGEKKLSGLLFRPDVLTCPVCKAQAEQRDGGLRYIFIPSPFAGVIGKQLSSFTPAQRADGIGRGARQFLEQRDAIAGGNVSTFQAPFPLKKKEDCIYTSPRPGALYEQRTQKNQPYWAETEQGTIVITTLAIYVGHNSIPLSKIHSATSSTAGLDFTRVDRKRPQRITFADGQTAHLAFVALARLIPNVVRQPQLSSESFKQGLSSFGVDLSIPVSIPMGQGQYVKLPVHLAVILTSVTLALICACSRLAFVATDMGLRQVGMLPTFTPTPTQTFTPTTTRTPTSTPIPTYTPTPESTKTPTPTPTAIILPTPTLLPPPVAEVTNRVLPQVQAVIAVNLRSGPGTLYPVVGAASIGDVLSVIGANQEGDWLQVTNDEGMTCWVSGNPKYVQVLDEASLLNVPVVEVPPPPTSTSAPSLVPSSTPEIVIPPTATAVQLPAPSGPSICQGATAICGDGTCSYSAHRQGTCSHHGGVSQWLK